MVPRPVSENLPVSLNLSSPELQLLLDGACDDVAFEWVVIHLELRGNPPKNPGPPVASTVEQAFVTLARLSELGLVDVGRVEYVDGGPAGRVAPVRHVPEALEDVKHRVMNACVTGSDWEYSCWVVSTPKGAAVVQGI